MRSLTINPGTKMLVLPNGEVYNLADDADPIEVTLEDAEYFRISPHLFVGDTPVLVDGGQVPVSTIANVT